MLSFRQMQVVDAVIRMGTVSSAADFLGVSGPAVSMILRDAADAAGFPLFTRLRGAMRPTQEAQMLSESIKKVLEAHADAEKMALNLAGMKMGRMMIASIPTLTGHLLPIALAELARTNPDIDCHAMTMRGAEVLEEVRKQHFHVGLTIGAGMEKGIFLFNLCKGRLIAVVRRDHPIAHHDEVDLRMLAGFPITSVPKNSPVGRLFHGACGALGVEAVVPFEVNHASAAIAFAKAGLGIAVVDPLSAPGAEHPDLKVVRLAPTIEMTLQVALSASDRPSRSTLRLISALRKVIKQQITTSDGHLWATHWRNDDTPAMQ